MKMMHKALVLAAMTFAVSSQAAQLAADPSMAVSATIVANCTAISTEDIAFGSVNQGVEATDDALVSVTCGAETLYSVGVEGGGNQAVAGGTRRLADGNGNFLPYSLKDGALDIGTADVVGFPLYTATTEAPGSVKTGTGNALAQTFTVTGSVTADDTLLAPAGDYTDTVVVAVAF